MPIHLRAEPSDYAPAVLVPGDPKRATYIAETFFDPGARLVNEVRGALGYTGTFRGQPISVQSVGMGGPSAAIYYTELIRLGVQRLIRVGTAGGIQPHLRMADTVVAIGATADDRTVDLLTDGDPHAPVASYGLLETTVRLARESGATVHVGSVVSGGLFYDPRQGVLARYASRGHLAVEMEVSVLYTLAAIHGIEAIGLMTISDIVSFDDGTSERISDEELQLGVDRMMQVACQVAVA